MELRLEEIAGAGLEDVLPTDEDLAKFYEATERNFYRGAHEWLKEAKRNAPISPTVGLLKKLQKAGGTVTLPGKGVSVKPQAVSMTFFYRASAAALKRRKEGTLGGTAGSLNAWKNLTRSHDTPGALTNSIQAEFDPEHMAVFVPSNSEAGEYAEIIHDEKGVKWKERGPGTQAKGEQADEKFIERAMPGAFKKFSEAMNKALLKLFRV